MAVITKAYSEVDGAIAEASSINNIFDQLFTLQAGNLNSANLGTSVVGAGNIKANAVIEGKIIDGAVTVNKIEDSSILSSKISSLSYEVMQSTSIWVAQRLFLEGF